MRELAKKRWSKPGATHGSHIGNASNANLPILADSNQEIIPLRMTPKQAICIATFLATGNKTEAGLVAYDTENRIVAYQLADKCLKTFGVTLNHVFDAHDLGIAKAVKVIKEGLSAQKTQRLIVGPSQVQEYEDIDYGERRRYAQLLLQARQELAPAEDGEKANDNQALCAEMMSVLHSIRENTGHIAANTAKDCGSASGRIIEIAAEPLSDKD